jgi:hypothetical protein
MNPAPYPRTYPVAGGTFEPDRTWGTIFIVLYGLMLAVALFFALLVLGAIGFAAASGPRPSVPMPFMVFGPAFATVIVVALTATLGIHIVGAVGIHRSQAWGFWLTIILSVLSLLGSSGGTCLTIVPLIYSIIRLSGGYGPKPT